MTNAILSILAAAIMAVEDGGSHRNGPFQITAICREDFNRHHPGHTLTAAECRTRKGGYRVFCWYTLHYSGQRDSVWEWACRWNGGPDGVAEAVRYPYGRIADYAARVDTMFWKLAKAELARAERELR